MRPKDCMLQARPRRPNRRQIIAGGGASVLALSGGFTVAAPVMAAGHVFHDRHGTGRRMPGDPGVPGVMVSNGRDVVVTDADGRWRLPAASADSIFLIKPSHWAIATGPGGVPRIGALDHIDPGARLVDIDFPLTRQHESAQFEAVLMADTQPADAAELGYLSQDVLAGIAGSGAAFGINHGDVVFDNLALYSRYLSVLGSSGIPWHHCPGNHDIDRGAADDASSRDTWKANFGRRHYAFQYADATFIILDNVYYQGGSYCGLIGASQLAFVHNVLAQLAPDRLVVVSMHIPLMNYQNAASSADNTADRRALLGLLSTRRYSVSFAGHMHLTEHHYFGAEAGFYAASPHHHHVLTAASGGWWSGPKDTRGIPSADAEDGNPNGYHVLAVDGCHYSTRFVPAAGKPSVQLRASIEGPHQSSSATVRQADLGSSELVVNVFDGGPGSRVSYSITGLTGAPRVMQRVASTDPHVARVFARHAALQKPWMRALPSSHLWRAPLPPELRPGAYCATVSAEDEYGRRLGAHLLFEVMAPDMGT